MLVKFMHKLKDAVENISQKDRKRVIASGKALNHEQILVVQEVDEFINKYITSPEDKEIFLLELKKFHLQGKTTLKLDIQIGKMPEYRAKVKVEKL